MTGSARNLVLVPIDFSYACLEVKREDNQNCSVLLCTTVVHNDTHTDSGVARRELLGSSMAWQNFFSPISCHRRNHWDRCLVWKFIATRATRWFGSTKPIKIKEKSRYVWNMAVKCMHSISVVQRHYFVEVDPSLITKIWHKLNFVQLVRISNMHTSLY